MPGKEKATGKGESKRRPKDENFCGTTQEASYDEKLKRVEMKLAIVLVGGISDKY